jgi:hypothetical protein
MEQNPSEKLTHPHLAKKSPPLYGPWRFITVFPIPSHVSLSEPNEFSPHPSIMFKINFNIIFLPRTSKWFLFLIYYHHEPVWIYATSPDQLIILDLITEIISGAYQSWRFSVYNFLQPSLIQISCSAPHYQTSSAYVISLIWQMKIHTQQNYRFVYIVFKHARIQKILNQTVTRSPP